MKRKLALLLTLVMVLGSFAACGKGSGQDASAPSTSGVAATKPADPGKVTYNDNYGYNVLRLALDAEIETADVQLTTADYTIPMNIYDCLVSIQAKDDGSSEIVPSLAEKWTVSEDGLVYTFNLRQGVKFHNGEELEADDVKYTVERMMDPERLAKNTDCMDMIKGAKDMLEGKATEVAGVKIVDKYTVELTLEQAYAPFLANLCVPGASIYNREACDLADEKGGGKTASQFGNMAEYTIGTGPFKMKDWVLNDHIYLETFSDYWKGASKLDGVLFTVVADNETRNMLFESGQLDEFDLDSAREKIDYYVNSTDWKDNVIVGNRVGTYYYSINESLEPFNNVLVRKAFQRAINRQAILDAMYAGAGVVANGIFAPGMIGWNDKLPAIEYNLEEAKAMLAEAGYENGFEMTICQTTDSPTTLSINEIVQAQLSEIGITVKIEQMDSATWYDVRRTGALPMYMTSWSADFNDPDNFIYTFFSDKNTVTRSFNYGNKDAMERIEKARYMVDPEARVKEYQELEKLVIQEDAAWIPLFHLQHVWVFSDRINGYTPHWAGWSGTCYWNVSIDAQ